MGREIKFRLYDFKLKKMFYKVGIEPKGVHIFTIDKEGDKVIHLPNKYALMQFSNMYDKNGKEIYEGDILKIENEDHEVIEVICKFEVVRRTMDTGWTVDIPSFCFERKDGLKSFPIVNNYAGKHDLEMLEVVGNIYEQA